MTNREIAKKLGISPAALSIIINHKEGVSDATRQRVLEELEKMGLSGIIRKSVPQIPSKNLGFIIFKKDGMILNYHSYFLSVIEQIEQIAEKHGYHILVSTAGRQADPREQAARIAGSGAAGLLLFSTEMEEADMIPFMSLSRPVVALDNAFPSLSCNTVSIDNRLGTAQAIHHLVSHGHTKIGYLKSITRIQSFEERLEGYEKALAGHGLSLPPEYTIPLSFTEEESFLDMRAYLKSHPAASLPTAFVADDDTLAIGAMRAMQEKGIRVPEDISVIGFNDRPDCRLADPALTTINTSISNMIADGVETLCALLDQESGEGNGKPSGSSGYTRKVHIGTQLVVRDSCGPAQG